MTDIKTLAVATDTAIAEELFKLAGAQSQIERYTSEIYWSANAKYEIIKFERVYSESIGSVIDSVSPDNTRVQEIIAKYRQARTEANEIGIRISNLNAIYLQHKWTRAYLVTNANGHVHKNKNCSTCFPSTNYLWLTQYSGSPEEIIVSDAGQDACTVCYPSAPAEVLNRPSVIVTEEKLEKEARKAERAEAKRVREAKRIASAPTIDGSELLVSDGWKLSNGNFRVEELKTERTARIWYVDKSESLANYGQNKPEDEVAVIKESLENILSALAGKHGVSVDAVRADLDKKVAKRVKEFLEAREKWNRTHGSYNL